MFWLFSTSVRHLIGAMLFESINFPILIFVGRHEIRWRSRRVIRKPVIHLVSYLVIARLYFTCSLILLGLELGLAFWGRQRLCTWSFLSFNLVQNVVTSLQDDCLAIVGQWSFMATLYRLLIRRLLTKIAPCFIIWNSDTFLAKVGVGRRQTILWSLSNIFLSRATLMDHPARPAALFIGMLHKFLPTLTLILTLLLLRLGSHQRTTLKVLLFMVRIGVGRVWLGHIVIESVYIVIDFLLVRVRD